jgi:hypothetical protein
MVACKALQQALLCCICVLGLNAKHYLCYQVHEVTQ